MAVMMVAGEVHRLLVDRGCDDDVGLPGCGEFNRPGDITNRRLTRDRADLSDFGKRRIDRDLLDSHGARRHLSERCKAQTCAGSTVGPHKSLRAADHHEIAPLPGRKARERLDDHLRADARGITERDRDLC